MIDVKRACIYIALTTGLNAAAADEASTVKVVGNYDNAVGSSNAASQGTVNSTLIASRPTLRTGEILELIPGMIVTQHSGDGKANQYFLRGFNLDHGTDFATFVDGMPVNMRTHAHGQGYTDINFVIPELVGRIDYKKGPYYADEGDFASAGAAHMTLANKPAANGASVSVGENQYYRSVVTGSTPLGAGNLVYGAELGHNNGPWVTPEAFHKSLGVLRYAQGASDRQFSVTGMFYQGAWHASTQIPLRAVRGGELDPFGVIDPSDGGATSRYSLSATMRKRGGDSLFQANAYVVRSSLTLFNDFTYFLDDPVGGDQSRQTEKRRLTGFDVGQTWFGNWGGLDVSNKVGAQGRYDDISPLGLYKTVRQRTVGVISESRVKQASVGAYVENAVQWLPWMRTTAGVRHDRYRFDVDSNIAENSGKVDAGTTSPKFTMVLGPWSNSEFFVNYGAGFHSNDARGTTVRLTPKEREPVDPVTPLVKTRGAEIGARTEFLPGLQSSMALWKLRSASELVFSGDAGDTAASRGSYRSGIEWNNHYIANPWLQFDLDLAYSRSRYTEHDPAGDHIPGAIGKVASFGVTVANLGPWSGALQMRYFGPRPLIEDNSVRSQATTLAYARVGYHIDAKTRLSLDVFNLFDRQGNDIDYYYASRLPGEPAAGVDDLHFHPQEPRSFRLTLNRNF